MENFIKWFSKRIPFFYCMVVIVIGILVIIEIITQLIGIRFRLTILFQKYFIEFLFLLFTGHFLYSLRYEVLGIPITFNTFIIYISNFLLKGDYFKGIELVYLFIVVYFLSQLLVSLIGKKYSLEIIESIMMRIIMWYVLIYIFNYLTAYFKIDIVNLTIRDILIVLLLILIHLTIKAILVTTERLFQRKYYNFFQHTLPYIVIDFLFIYFSLILGSVYQKIGLLNSAFFISFLAVGVYLTSYITKKEYDNNLFYALHSFFQPIPIYQKAIFPFLPVNRNLSLDRVLNKSIYSLTFICFYQGDFIKTIPVTTKSIKSRFFIANKQFICSIIPGRSPEAIDDLKSQLEKVYKTDFYCAYCSIDRQHWHLINLNYIFRVLFYRLKKHKEKEIILALKQDYILT
ncbi:MAG: hypothetical protein MJB14_16375 [Spirochaetes bacterium]|nr:hypothetical protein [Spirochaetota bacterium]